MPPIIRKSNLRNSRLQFKPFGDWGDTIRIIGKLDSEIKICSLSAQQTICEDIKERVLGHLRNQDLGWRSLNRKYSKRKNKKGLDNKTLIAYGNYYNAIETWTIGNQHLVMVGVKTGVYTKKLSGRRNPLEVSRIALIHEFSRGTKIPRRPLWNPTINEMGGARGLKSLFLKHFKSNMKIHGIPLQNLRGIKF